MRKYPEHNRKSIDSLSSCQFFPPKNVFAIPKRLARERYQTFSRAGLDNTKRSKSFFQEKEHEIFDKITHYLKI